VDHQSVLLGIDVRLEGLAGRRYIVKRRWRDVAKLILDRREIMIRDYLGRLFWRRGAPWSELWPLLAYLFSFIID
jgi:hypothetical protein